MILESDKKTPENPSPPGFRLKLCNKSKQTNKNLRFNNVYGTNHAYLSVFNFLKLSLARNIYQQFIWVKEKSKKSPRNDSHVLTPDLHFINIIF